MNDNYAEVKNLVDQEKQARLRLERKLEDELAKIKAEGGGGKGFGKGSRSSGGLGQARLEARSRTIYFGRFPDNTSSEDIAEFMKTRLGSFIDKVDNDGICANGKPIATSGSVRFKTEVNMWDFLPANKGHLNHVFREGVSKVYINTDDAASGQDPARSKAMRKITRAVIETVGGDGEALKNERLSRDYRKGVLKLKSMDGTWEEIASWSEDKQEMEFKTAGQRFLQAFLGLMGPKA